MEILFEVLKTVLPAVIAGIFTFFVTKFQYNLNAPLDKLEITYNRVYYPLYGIVYAEGDNNDIDKKISKAKYYFDKYRKYIDRSTIRAFDVLCQCKTNTQKKTAYRKFKSNIFDKCSYLRRKLGYLEPGLIEMYKYSSDTIKLAARILAEAIICYTFTIIAAFSKGNIQIYFISFTIISIIIMLIEVIWSGIKSLYYKIRK